MADDADLMTDDSGPDAPAHDGHEKRPDMTPAEVLARLADGKPVEGVRVRRLKLRGEFPHPVTFKNCVLVQPEFGTATFKGDLVLAGCTVDRPVFTKPVTVEGNFGLNGSTVNKALFFDLTVKGKGFFGGTRFRGKLLFTKCSFGGRVSWWEAAVECWAEFRKCGFGGEADFRSVHCDQGLIFGGCTFAADFLFRGATVAKKLSLDGSRFDGLVDLSKAKLNDFAYLEGIEQGPAQAFAFANAVAERLLVRPEQVEGRLASEAAGRHEEAMHEYGLLKKCYQGQHRFDAEDWAFYRFKVNQRRAKSCCWSRPWTKVRRFFGWLFLDVGCGYGTNPMRAVRMAVLIILGFAVWYGLNVDSFHNEKVPFPGDDVGSFGNRVMIGLTTSVAVFTSGMGGVREVAKGWMNVPVMVESVMGTLLFGLFIVAFSRKVIR